MSEPRYLVGIDLGTTNSAVAFVDLQGGSGRPRVRLLQVPQVVAPGEIAPRDVLPSFLYFPSPAELAGTSLRLPWAREASPVVGVFAREQGALLPTRQVASTKSWLSNAAADRSARILPWGADEPLISPVEASARILGGLRDAWDHVVGQGAEDARLERQAIVLTVPASFDQEARELTLEAARAAGLEHVTLLEEPLAAFYAWIASHRPSLKKQLRNGQRVLVCDVGGGTTDFTLIAVTVREGRLAFERTAVGEHLLLGGDNLDLALARRIEHRLGDRGLTLVQRLALRRSVSAAKERLLSEPGCERVPITILGSGRAVVGGALVADLALDDVVETLEEGFLPLVPAGARPAREKRRGLRELGLPYAEDAAITRHLAAFLEAAASAERVGGGPEAEGDTDSEARTAERGADHEAASGGRTTNDGVHDAAGMVRPDAILFNGGFFTPRRARDRVVEAIASWFDPGGTWRPDVLENKAPAAAVALGAASYALVRETGDGLRVRAGSARGYYIGVATADAAHGDEDNGLAAETGLCILPRGTEEGSVFDLGARRFAVVTNRPVSFQLMSSTTRRDAAGDLVALDGEWAHRHAPLTTVLRFGKKSRHAQIDVGLTAAYTETGTLEVACASRETDHRWALRFQLRGEREALELDDEDAGAGQESEAVIPPERLAAAKAEIASAFGEAVDADAGAPEVLPARLEAILGFARQAWPLAVIRVLADRLLELAEGRRKGARYEARWLNLLGFCLRPGFGAELDEWRVGKARAVYAEGPVFASDLQVQVEWIVLWQRVAGGLKAGQQRELYQRYATLLEVKSGRRPKRLNTQLDREGWRLLASLEHLSARERLSLGEALLGRLQKDPENASYLWAIGRLGARVPAYGPSTAVVPADRAEAWIGRLLERKELGSEYAAAVAQIGARTDDPLRDISEAARRAALDRLDAAGFTAQAEPLRTCVRAAARDALQVFGESLPQGLRLL